MSILFSSNSAETRDIHRCLLPQELRKERVLQRLGLAQRARVYHSHWKGNCKII